MFHSSALATRDLSCTKPLLPFTMACKDTGISASITLETKLAVFFTEFNEGESTEMTFWRLRKADTLGFALSKRLVFTMGFWQAYPARSL